MNGEPLSFIIHNLPFTMFSCQKTILKTLIPALALSFSVLGCAPTKTAPPERPPQLIIEDTVASDFEALATETWTEFLSAFQAQNTCFGNVSLRATHTLNSRAAYNPTTATVTVRVPGTTAMLQSALIHEWAHHVEFQCPAHKSLRPVFLLAQHLPPNTPWRLADAPTNTPASNWDAIPSEQYAEASIEVVLGNRPVPTKVHLTQEAVDVVARWARGSDK